MHIWPRKIESYNATKCYGIIYAIVKSLHQNLKRKFPEDSVNEAETCSSNIRLCAFIGVINEWLNQKQCIFDNFAYT